MILIKMLKDFETPASARTTGETRVGSCASQWHSSSLLLQTETGV
jgi:hypothetical protein